MTAGLKSDLIRVSVVTDAHGEELASEVLEGATGAGASSYTDAETGRSTVSVYIERGSWSRIQRQALRRRLAETGLPGVGGGFLKVSVRKVRREDWAESWKKHFKPIEIGSALIVVPGWSRRRARRGQARVVLDPGLSFGTGQHATTLFCLEQIVACRRAGVRSLLDVGTGSGILAIAAAKLGYRPVHAFDFDPDAVRASDANAAANGVGDMVRPERKDLTRLPARSRERFDVICANLVHDLLISQAPKLVNRLAPGGSLIAAGILDSQFDSVRGAYERLGLKLLTTRRRKEWRSGRFGSA